MNILFTGQIPSHVIKNSHFVHEEHAKTLQHRLITNLTKRQHYKRVVYLLTEIEVSNPSLPVLLKLYGEINHQLPHVSVTFEVAFHDASCDPSVVFRSSLAGLEDE